jgi:hypothetical protein
MDTAWVRCQSEGRKEEQKAFRKAQGAALHLLRFFPCDIGRVMLHALTHSRSTWVSMEK